MRVSLRAIQVHTWLCASNCGRERLNRSDPFTLEEANIDFFAQFKGPSPDDHLIAPEGRDWALVRIGDASCYDQEQGLMQPGLVVGHNKLVG